MKKFNVVVTITQEYEVEIDETIYNDEWKKDFEKSFWDLDDGLESVAKNLATHKGLGRGSFQEGYGLISVNNKNPNFEGIDKCVKGLNINIIDEDNDIDCEVIEIEINQTL